ncbi:hypothetical protein ABTN43_20010, partial [Acinetobacter baumannii]
IDTRYRLPDNSVGIYSLDRDVIGKFEPDVLARDKFTVADAPVVVAPDQAVFHRQIGNRQIELLRSPRYQEVTGLCGGLA